MSIHVGGRQCETIRCWVKMQIKLKGPLTSVRSRFHLQMHFCLWHQGSGHAFHCSVFTLPVQHQCLCCSLCQRGKGPSLNYACTIASTVNRRALLFSYQQWLNIFSLSAWIFEDRHPSTPVLLSVPLSRVAYCEQEVKVSKSLHDNPHLLLTKVKRTSPQEMHRLSSVPAVSQTLSCSVEISHDKQTQMCKHIQGDTFPKQQIIIGNVAVTVLIIHD